MNVQSGGSRAMGVFAPQLRDPGEAIALSAVEHRYGELQTIDSIELEIAAHSVIGLVGPSGCGKSTLLELICGLREPSAGRIEVGGESDAKGRLARCAY